MQSNSKAILPVGLTVTLIFWFVGKGGFMPLMLTIICAVIAGLFTNRFVLLRSTSYIPSLIMAVLLTCNMTTGLGGMVGLFVCILFAGCLSALFSAYQHKRPSPQAFMAHLCLGVASIIVPQLVWFFPALWTIQVVLSAANAKSFCASLLGLITPYWILGLLSVCNIGTDLWQSALDSITDFQGIGYSGLSRHALCFILVLAFLFIISLYDYFTTNTYHDKTRTRFNHLALLLLSTVLIFVVLMQPLSASIMLPSLEFMLAIRITHFSVQKGGRGLIIANSIIALLLLAIMMI